MSDSRNDDTAALIQTHVARYPELDITDVYKLLHQGVFGPGHSIPNRKAAREWLEQEARQQTPRAGELLLESVHPQNEVVRLHLRPYLAANGELPALLDAYIKSADTVPGEQTSMAAWWEVFAEMVAPGGLLFGRFEPRTVALIGRTRANEHWAASHHSPVYNTRYRPVYRVLMREQAEALLYQQKIRFEIA